MMAPVLRLAAIASFVLVYRVAAHEHHDDMIPEGEGVSPDPIVCLPNPQSSPPYASLTPRQDTTLWIHILIQILSFGLIFPTGMILGVLSPHIPLPRAAA